MSIQIIWRRLTQNDASLSMAMSLFRPLPLNPTHHLKFSNFCTQIVTPSKTPPDRRVVSDFLIVKCGLTVKDIAKAFRHCSQFLRAKSGHNLEEVLKLLNECGLTSPAQIRRVVLWNPSFFFHRAERNIKAKLSFLRSFMKEEDVAKIVYKDTRIFNVSECKLKSAVSFLQKMGIEGEALSDLLVRRPRLFVTSEERVIESFKQAECFGLKKGSKMFAIAVREILGLRKENLDRKLQCWSSLGFSEKQISDLLKRKPWILGVSEEKMKRTVDFMVKTAGIPLADIVKYPSLFGYNLETRVIPRYRVVEALKSIQVQVPKRGLCFPKIIMLTEKQFLEKYVNLNAESSSVLQEIYQGGKAGKLVIDKDTRSERVSVKKIHQSRESWAASSI